MVGLDEIRALAHVMEDLLAAARAAGALPAELVEPLLRGADALRGHVEGGGEPTATLIAELAARRPSGNGAVAEPRPRRRRRPARSRRRARAPLDPGPGGEDRHAARPRRRDRPASPAARARARQHGGNGAERRVSDELDIGERLLDGLKDAAIGMRTLPLASIVTPLPRAVRDLAAESGKEVELVVEGAETELDRVILEGLSDPLIHLLRNSIAHGIEAPQERERIGKPARGRLELRAEQRGGVVEVTVADDGRGVSEETFAEARRTGSLTEVLTRPGFSTASEVSDISGRGVGLDAVKEQVEGFGGSLEVRSEPGRGTEVVLRLPLALALIEVLLVERAGNVYGFPLASVEEALSLGETLSLAGRPALELRGRSIPLADLAELMGAPAEAHRAARRPSSSSRVGRRVAVICDALLGKEEVVVKSLGPLLASLRGYLGAAILGDGRIALLVDPARWCARPRSRRARPPRMAALAEPSAPKVLVVEDSLTIRELQRSILEAAGYRVQTASDGRDALTHLDRDDGDRPRRHRRGDARDGRDRADADDPRPRDALVPARRDRHVARRGGRPRAEGSRRAPTPTWSSASSTSTTCSRPSNGSSAGDVGRGRRGPPGSHLRGLPDLRGRPLADARSRPRDRGRRRVLRSGGDDRPARSSSSPTSSRWTSSCRGCRAATRSSRS